MGNKGLLQPKGFTKTMGLAASQARFLGITLRKANCEFKSTELAQQRLELTGQMTDISQEYSNALNSTKLVWRNEGVTDSFGNPTDFGISYSLLMMPSAANDFNPFMISTRSGAIVLSSKYAQAAKDAGISMAGGAPSAEGRNKFIKSLANYDFTTGNYVDSTDNVITSHTAEKLTSVGPSSNLYWSYSAGMGAVPKDKGIADATTLTDLIRDKDIGGQLIDWLQIDRALQGLTIDEATTDIDYQNDIAKYKDNISKAKLAYINAEIPGSTFDSSYVNNVESTARGLINTSTNPVTVSGTILNRFVELEEFIKNESNISTKMQYQNELELLKTGKEQDPADRNSLRAVDGDEENLYKYPLYWSIYEQSKAEARSVANKITWDTVDIGKLFQTSDWAIGDGTYTNGTSTINQLTLVVNDSINRNANEIKSMTIGDLLSDNIVLITKGSGSSDTNPIKSVSTAANAVLDYIAKVFGYGNIGYGLNIDSESNAALEQALSMTKKKFVRESNAVKSGGKEKDSMLDNSAYLNAKDFNRIGATENGNFAAINLSNMVSAFLTYYDNFLRGADSGYVVGKGNTDGKTVFVTDDSGYIYVTNSKDEITNDEKISDFYNELYNNICDHGWRYDDAVIDNEHLESAIKDGRYQIMALNGDGYFYQMRYNELGYMIEETDKDAIARAEVEYTRKKSEITYKEDSIDIKTKKLDAEITELNTELNSVQNIISKAIEKTFSMFSS